MTISKITKDAFTEIASTVEPQVQMLSWRGKVVAVRKTISIDEIYKLVNDIVSTCFDANKCIARFEMLDFCKRVGIIIYYTDIEISGDPTIDYNVLYNTDLIEQIKKKIDISQYETICHIVDLYLEGLLKSGN